MEPLAVATVVDVTGIALPELTIVSPAVSVMLEPRRTR
jgi:hypothetical protein